MVTIRLLGEAGRRFGRRFQLAVRTPAEAMRALCVQIPALRHYLLESGDKGVNWRVVTEHADGLAEDQLLWPMSKRMVLAPLPAGRGGAGKIVAGVALVAAAIVFAPVGGGFLGLGMGVGGGVGFGMIGPVASGIIGSIGVSMIFGGVAEMLTPTPKMPNFRTGGGRNEVEQLNSFTFDKSNANTVQGEVVPVLYGERIIGALPVLSFGLELQNFL
jgi:predicted phage tail protein|tara:strand:+ start:3321 stop:3968 length:648 start_codon:yes stop_codon:yes gene_type:complete